MVTKKIDGKTHFFYDESQIVKDIETTVRFEILNKQYVFTSGKYTGRSGVAKDIYVDTSKKGIDSVYVVVKIEGSSVRVPYIRFWDYVQAVPIGRTTATGGKKTVNDKKVANLALTDRQPSLNENKDDDIDIYKKMFGLDLVDEDPTPVVKEEIPVVKVESQIDVIVPAAIPETPTVAHGQSGTIGIEGVQTVAKSTSPVALILENTRIHDEFPVNCVFPMSIAQRSTYELLVNTFGKEEAFEQTVNYYINQLNMEDLVNTVKEEIKRNVSNYYNGSTSLSTEVLEKK